MSDLAIKLNCDCFGQNFRTKMYSLIYRKSSANQQQKSTQRFPCQKQMWKSVSRSSSILRNFFFWMVFNSFLGTIAIKIWSRSFWTRAVKCRLFVEIFSYILTCFYKISFSGLQHSYGRPSSLFEAIQWIRDPEQLLEKRFSWIQFSRIARKMAICVSRLLENYKKNWQSSEMDSRDFLDNNTLIFVSG